VQADRQDAKLDSLGGLVEAVNNLKTQTGRQGARLDSISHRVYAATVVLMVAVPVLAFSANLFVPLISSVLHLNIPAVPNK